MEVDRIRKLADDLLARLETVVVGQRRNVELMLTALLAEGHILLEGVPGTGKTLLARVFSACLDMEFKRIQFTPDLMPGDVIGTNLFDFSTSAFTFVRGPIFTEFLLADEINRTPPKTQSALLEAMQEHSVTIDGKTHALPPSFMVVATQNPIEQEGTYPLPEAQLDRFLFKLRVRYPERSAECEMVRIHGHSTATTSLDGLGLEPICAFAEVAAARRTVAGIRLSEEMVAYVVDLVRATREHPSLVVGASPRAANMLASSARAFAALAGRSFVVPDDVKSLWAPTLRHRVVLAPGAELEGRTAEEVMEQVLEQVQTPR